MRQITKIKAKYYSREVLKYLLLAGATYIAASSPYFILRLMKEMKNQRVSKRKVISVFNYLRRQGLIEIRREGHDISIGLTDRGREKAGRYQIDDLKIERPKKWDRKWRLVIFDIPTTSGMVRDIFRKKLKELGFYMLQKSIWIFPFECKEEIGLLREFLGATKREIQLLEVTRVEDDRFLRKYFVL